MPDAQRPILLAARLTGLSPQVGRIREQGQLVFELRRTAVNHRLCSQIHIVRLGRSRPPRLPGQTRL